MTEEAELARHHWTRRSQPLPRRRAVTEAVAGATFIAAAIVLALTAEADREFALGPAVVLVLMFALGIRARIDVGVAYTSPVQLAFVPMLFVLPTPDVPLFVLLAWFLGRLPDLWDRKNPLHPDRLVIVPTDCWFALGPALVLTLADAQIADWGDWPIYIAALAAQFSFEAVASYLREWIGEGMAPQLVLRELATIWAIDALLSPLGLLAAFASMSFEYAFVLLVAPAAMLNFYARERTRRLESALALTDALRDREGLIAGASHELVTPLGILVGLTGRLTGPRELTPERRAEVDTVVRREVIALRQIVRQFVDYTRLKTERDLQIEPQPIALAPIAEDVGVALAGSGAVTVEAAEAVPPALVDPDRAHQMITAIAMEALEGSDTINLSVRDAGDAVIVTAVSPHAPRERPFAEGGEGSAGGLGLFITRELARVHGGELNAEATPDGGARYILELPRAQ